MRLTIDIATKSDEQDTALCEAFDRTAVNVQAVGTDVYTGVVVDATPTEDVVDMRTLLANRIRIQQIAQDNLRLDLNVDPATMARTAVQIAECQGAIEELVRLWQAVTGTDETPSQGTILAASTL